MGIVVCLALRVLHLVLSIRRDVGLSVLVEVFFCFWGSLSAKTARNAALFFRFCFSEKWFLFFGSFGTVLSGLGVSFRKVLSDELLSP